MSTEDEQHQTLHAWPDADLNGEVMHTRSTGGMVLEVCGFGDRGMALGFGCKKQTSTALHTPESEAVTLAILLRNEFLTMQIL